MSSGISVRALILGLLVVVLGCTASASAQQTYDVGVRLGDGHQVSYKSIAANDGGAAANIAWSTMRSQGSTTATPALRRSFDVSITLADSHRMGYSGLRAKTSSDAQNTAWNKMRNGSTTTVTATTAPPPPPPPPAGDDFPNPSTTGTPAGWVPSVSRSADLTVTTDGAVVQDLRLTNGANIDVRAKNVIIRRVDLQGGSITNQYGAAPQSCGTNLLVEDTTFGPVTGQAFKPGDFPAIGEGGYTARRVEMDRRGEGFRASDCGPTVVEDSFAYIKGAEAGTQACEDIHSDGIQAYFAVGATVRNDAFIFGNYCGTSPIWIPAGQGNTGTYEINHVLVSGAGFSTRIGVPASVTGLNIVNSSWVYGPIDVACSVVSPWDAQRVSVDSSYAVTGVVATQPCNT